MSSPSPAGSRRSRSSDDDATQCSKCRRQLSLSFFAAEGARQFATCNICRANQRRRRQQRRGLNTSAVSERSAEDASLLSVPNPPRRNVTHGVMSERYHLGGKVETDTVAMAPAQQDRAGIQRRHRLNVAMVMTHHRHPLLSRWLLATRYLKAQKNLHHSALYNPLILPSLETSLAWTSSSTPSVAAGNAMSAAHWARVGSFRQALYGEVKEYCSQCHEEWFNIQLNRDADEEPLLLSDDNDMDPGEVPEHLPALSQVEEMLIARVHLHLEAKRIRGLQYQYTGHTVCFMNDSTKLYDTLPLLPRHLDLFLLRPPQSGGPLPRQYLNDFKVNRSKIVQWLTFLQRNCPAYRDILIDADALSQLPEDGNVLDDILTLDDDLDGGDATDSDPPDGEGLDDNDALEFHHSSSVVPDLLVDLSTLSPARAPRDA
ncbi:hypothetical protein V8E54_013026 [Elaphomyces granulatus]